jgi:hypothetical protein
VQPTTPLKTEPTPKKETRKTQIDLLELANKKADL